MPNKGGEGRGLRTGDKGSSACLNQGRTNGVIRKGCRIGKASVCVRELAVVMVCDQENALEGENSHRPCVFDGRKSLHGLAMVILYASSLSIFFPYLLLSASLPSVSSPFSLEVGAHAHVFLCAHDRSSPFAAIV